MISYLSCLGTSGTSTFPWYIAQSFYFTHGSNIRKDILGTFPRWESTGWGSLVLSVATGVYRHFSSYLNEVWLQWFFFVDIQSFLKKCCSFRIVLPPYASLSCLSSIMKLGSTIVAILTRISLVFQRLLLNLSVFSNKIIPNLPTSSPKAHSMWILVHKKRDKSWKQLLISQDH